MTPDTNTGMTDDQIRARILEVVRNRFVQSEDRRREALLEFLGVSMPGLDERVGHSLVELIPPVLPDLYAKWANMFADRVLETVAREPLEDMCSGGKDNDATLALVFMMFLESERMETQVAEDLKAFGAEQTGGDELGDAAAQYLRAKLSQIAEGMKQGKMQ